MSNIWLPITKSPLQNLYVNHIVLSIDKRLTFETSEIKSIRSKTEKITKKLTEYEIILSKTTDKASLIYHRLKKMKNRLEKRKEKKLIET